MLYSWRDELWIVKIADLPGLLFVLNTMADGESTGSREGSLKSATLVWVA